MNDTKKPSPWVWISLSLIILLFVSFIIFLDQKIVKNRGTASDNQPAKSEQIKPVFDFYTVLPERTVEIPQKPKNGKPDIPNKNTAANINNLYILQAGSFRELVDADRHKAELALLGLEANIYSVTVSGKTYHRVELGPFDGGSQYSRVQKQLIENDISYITRKAN